MIRFRIIFTLIAVVAFVLTTAAENVVSLSSVSGKPGDEVTVKVSLSNTDAITALQLDMPWDASLTLVEGSAVLEPGRSDGHSASVSNTPNGIRLVVFGNTLKPLKGNEGLLCSFSVKLGYKPIIHILHAAATLAGPGGNPVLARVTDGSITTLLPDIKVVTESIDFGNQIIRGSYSKDLVVRNTGTDVLHISAIKTDDSKSKEISVVSSPVDIQPDCEATIPVLFKPVQRGKYNQQVEILSDAIDKASVYAEVLAESYSVNELHIGTGQGHSQDVVTVLVRMNNMEDVSAVQFTLNLPQELQFVAGSATSCYDGFAASSSQKEGSVSLMLYSLSGSLIPEGDRDIMIFQIKLIGAGGDYSLVPENVVIGSKGLDNIYSGAEDGHIQVQSPIISAPTNVLLESVEVDRPFQWNFDIGNVGEDPLVINKILFQTEEYKVLTPLPLTIQKGKTETLKMEYYPLQTGRQLTNMDIYSNDPTNSIVTTEIIADVYAPNALKVSGKVDFVKSEVYLEVSIDNYTPISALQADLKLAESLGDAVVVDVVSDLMKDYTVSCKPIGDGMCRLVAYTVQGAPLPPSRIHGQDEIVDRRILALHIPIKEGASVEGVLVSLENIKLSDANGADVSSYQTVQYEFTPIGLVYDVSGDGTVDITDVTFILKMIKEGVYHPEYDYDYDGSLTILDAQKVLMYYLQK